MTTRTRCAFAAAGLLAAMQVAPLAAQVPAPAAPPVPARVDSTPARDAAARDTAALEGEARADGRRAAGRRNVLGRAVLGFVGGVPVGLFGLFVIAAPREPVIVVPPAAGAALVGAAALAGPGTPGDSLAALAAARGPVYARAYREAYEERLRARRGKAAVRGGLVGAVTGLGLLAVLVSLFSHIDS